MNILSMILAYFAVDNKIKLFFLALFFFINKKITSMLQPTHLYKFVSISVIFFSFSLSHFLPSIFFSVFLLITNSKRVTMSICMFKKSSISNAKNLYQLLFYFLSFTFTPSPTPKCVTSLLLLYHIFLYN